MDNIQISTKDRKKVLQKIMGKLQISSKKMANFIKKSRKSTAKFRQKIAVLIPKILILQILKNDGRQKYQFRQLF